jgi:hypothetical protein
MCDQTVTGPAGASREVWSAEEVQLLKPGTLKILRIVAVFAFILWLAGGNAEAQSLQQGLISSDPQVRCDAFHELFGDEGEPRLKEHRELIYGKTTRQIYDSLGTPTFVGVLEHEGIQWLQVRYLFEVYPRKAPGYAKRAYQKGWRFGPSLTFRNGISVRDHEFNREVLILGTPLTPEHLRFKKGGQFP